MPSDSAVLKYFTLRGYLVPLFSFLNVGFGTLFTPVQLLLYTEIDKEYLKTQEKRFVLNVRRSTNRERNFKYKQVYLAYNQEANGHLD